VGQFEVVFPADIKYAKDGPAKAKFNNQNQINYLRSLVPKQQSNYPSNQNRGYNNPNPGYKKPFKPYTQSNPVQPANDYVPEEKESKRIGMTKSVSGIPLDEITQIYNTLSFTGKWIVATNIFPSAGNPGKYDCVFFISEKREGFDPNEYLFKVEEIKSAGGVKETSAGVY
jgi:hypothetical protein